MTLLVTLQQRWLVDVGFGDSFLKPLLLDERGEQVQGERGYTIAVDGDHLVLNQRLAKGEWKPQYRFTLEPRVYADYEALCRYQQTSPNSHFTRARICTLATTEGRVTLSEMRLIRTTADGTRTEQLLSTSEDYSNSLRDLFGIVLAGMPKQKTQADLTPA
jgi:N-hydroxyarylamine O-acetyltransferase